MRALPLSSGRPAWLSAVVASSLFLLAAPAAANGRYPAAGLIAIEPQNPDHMIVRTTFGLLTSSDGGSSFHWVCEQSIGFSDNEDPMVVITADGSVIAGVFNGLSRSNSQACSFSFAEGDLLDRYVIDVSTEREDPSRVIALASNGIGSGKFLTQVFESSDNGASWSQAGVDLPEDFLGLTLDAAPSDPDTLYLSGRFGAPDYTGALQRTKDRGATWERFDVTGSDDQHLPYLAAIDPSDPNKVYVRLDTPEADQLVFSADGGATWEILFEGTGALLGFALSPDGSTVAIGGDKDGLWTAPTDTFAFTKVSEVGVRCLTWYGEKLFACADEFKDGFQVGVSTDAGSTFAPLHHLQDLCPLACPSETSTGKTCPVRWGAVSLTIDASCDEGTGGNGGSAASGGTGASGGGSGGLCALGIGGPLREGGAAALVLAGALFALRRRRRSAQLAQAAQRSHVVQSDHRNPLRS